MRSRRTGWGGAGTMFVASSRAFRPGTPAPAPRRGPFGPANRRDLRTTLPSVVDAAGDARCPPLSVSGPWSVARGRLPGGSQHPARDRLCRPTGSGCAAPARSARRGSRGARSR
jgi:hypothetical protein